MAPSEALDVLVALGSSTVRQAVTSLLEEMTVADVTETKTFDEAAVQVRKAAKPFKLILCDRLGERGHLALLKLVRWDQSVLPTTLPVICIDGNWTSDELIAARDAGATTILTLPITLHLLQTTMSKALSDHQAFVSTPGFRGVERRAARIHGYHGPFRREVDSASDPLERRDASPPPADPRFEWSMALATGDDEIDIQHRRIFEILNELKNVTGGEDCEQGAVRNALSGLKDYVRVHFAHEERVMRTFDYDDRDAHRREHADFAARVAKLDAANFTSRKMRQTLLMFIQDWLTGHIAGTDRIMVAKMQGDYDGTMGGDRYAAQTALVVGEAYATAQLIQRMSLQLVTIDDRAARTLLFHDISGATDRLINLMALADTRIQVHGCNRFQLRRLGDIRSAITSNADSLAEAAAREMIDYGTAILGGQQGMPLGVGAILKNRLARIDSLVLVVGINAMTDECKTLVAKAAETAIAVFALEGRAAVELNELKTASKRASGRGVSQGRGNT